MASRAASPGPHPPIREMVQAIVEEVRPERVVLFGSHATGTPDGASDVDLLVVMDTDGDPAEACIRVRRAARRVQRGVAMDVLVLSPEDLEERVEQDDPLVEALLRTGEELYAAG